MNRQQKDDQEALDSFQRQKIDLDSKLKQSSHEMSESSKRVEKLSEHIKMYETSLDEQQRIRTELQGEVHTSKGMYNFVDSFFVLLKIITLHANLII